MRPISPRWGDGCVGLPGRVQNVLKLRFRSLTEYLKHVGPGPSHRLGRYYCSQGPPLQLVRHVGSHGTRHQKKIRYAAASLEERRIIMGSVRFKYTLGYVTVHRWGKGMATCDLANPGEGTVKLDDLSVPKVADDYIVCLPTSHCLLPTPT